MLIREWVCSISRFLALALIMVSCLAANAVANTPQESATQESEQAEEQETEEQEAEEQEGEEKADEKDKEQDADDAKDDDGDQEEKTENEDDEAKEDGTADLDKAVELSISARSTRDLDKIVKLCESALKKGLVGQDTEQANALLESTLFKHANQLAQRIFSAGQRDTRWQLYRREALVRINKLLKVNDKNSQAYLLKAKLNGLPGGDRDQVLKSIEKAVELAGDDATIQSEALVLRASASNNFKKKVADLTKAIEADPNNLDAIRLRGQAYLQKGDFEKATDDFRLWVEKEPENQNAFSVLIDALMVQEKTEEATEVLNQAIKANPDIARNYLALAQLYFQNEEDDAALEEIDRALKIDPNSVDALLLRVRVLFGKERYDEALEDVNDVLDNEPLLVQAIWLRSIIYSAQDRLPEAIEDVKVLASNDTNNSDYSYRLAMLYNANDEPEKSLRVYRRLLRKGTEEQIENIDKAVKDGRISEEIAADLKDQVAGFLRGRGDAYLSLSKHEEAIKDYEAALEIQPEDDGVLNNLAWVLATAIDEKNRDGERAVELATKAAELTEFKEAHILSTLASGYAESGNFEKAKEFANKALEISDDDDQKESLSKELASYEKGEPWREDQLKELEEKRAEAKAEKDGDKDEKEDADQKKKSDDDKDSDKDDEDGEDGDKEESQEEDEEGKEKEDDKEGDEKEGGKVSSDLDSYNDFWKEMRDQRRNATGASPSSGISRTSISTVSPKGGF